ncbi:MAG: UDP-N-acetylmuramoyl-tripeptide--D-alanyl-D-alanine ligase, partial [Sphingobacteriaceae bacterium]
EGGVVFVNGDDASLLEMAAARPLKHVIYYGTQNANNLINGKLIENSPHLVLEWWQRGSTIKHTVKSQLTGVYNLDNILAAIAVANHLGLSPDEICKGIREYQPKNNRSQVVQTATNTLICDYYNANPSSMAVAIDNIDKITADKKVLILGDMFEMGAEAAAEHKAIIEKALSINAEVIFIGKEFANQAPQLPEGGAFYENTEEAIVALQANPIKNATVLIKGSRGMALERLVELF